MKNNLLPFTKILLILFLSISSVLSLAQNPGMRISNSGPSVAASVTLQPDKTGFCVGDTLHIPVHITGDNVFSVTLYIEYDHTVFVPYTTEPYTSIYTGFEVNNYNDPFCASTMIITIEKKIPPFPPTGVNFTGQKLIDLVFTYVSPVAGQTDFHLRKAPDPPLCSQNALCILLDAVPNQITPVTYIDNTVSGFTVGSIAESQTICNGVAPEELTGTAPVPAGNYTYQWKNSMDNANFFNIPSATGLNYQPGALTTTTYFKQVQISHTGCSKETNVLEITVRTAFTAGTIGDSQTICYGEDPDALETLTGPTGGGSFTYQWQMSLPAGPWSDITDEIGTSYDPGPLTTTTLYRKQVTDGVCGNVGNTNELTITVNPLPAATASSNSPVCVGATLNLFGGPDDMFSYAWTGPDGFTSSLQNPSIEGVTLAAAGVYSLTVTDANGCIGNAITTVIVNPLPGAIASSNSPVCEGSTLNLFGEPTGAGLTYAWTGPDGFISTEQNPSIADVALTAAGDYTLTVTNEFGCTSTDITTVVVNPLPGATASSNTPVCVGATLELYGDPDGNTYAWTGPDGFISTLQDPTITNVTLAAAGVYNLTVTNSFGCISTANTTVVVNPLPGAAASSNTPVCVGATLELYGDPDGNTYAWTGPDGFISTLQDPTITNVTLAAAGVYNLTVTNSFGCISTANTTVVVNPLPLVSAVSLLSATSPTGPWTPVNGNLGEGYDLCIDALIPFYYLDVDQLTSNIPLLPGVFAQNGFNLNTTSLPSTWTNYWDAKGVNAGADPLTWQGVMYQIILGNQPMFYIYYTGTDYQLIDGMQYQFNGTVANLRVTGDYPQWNYTYNGKVTAANNCVSLPMTVMMEFNTIPAATASSNSPVCVGATLNLFGGPEGNTYAWTGPNGFTSTLQNPSITNVTLAAAGLYTLTVTGTNGCVGTANTTVVVNPLPGATASSNTPVCVGATLELYGDPDGNTYAWTGPDGFISTLQDPTITNVTLAAAGVYNLTVTNTFGCISTANTTVVVNPLPGATASSNSPVCVGGTLNLIGGPEGMSYAWTGPNGFTSTLQNPSITNVTLAAAGVYYLTVTSSFGCISTANTTVVVNVYEQATASSNSPVCVGFTLNLYGGPDGMTSYLWTGPNGFTSSLQNPSITNVTTDASGVYSLTVVNEFGCISSANTTVVINDLPGATASSNSPVCEGSTLNLIGGPSGAGLTYSWAGPNGFTSTLQSPSITNVTLAAAGTYNLTVTNNFGCTSTAYITVVVNPKPGATASSNSPVCVGAILNLFGGPSGNTYAWTGPNGFTSTLQNPSIINVTTAAAGVYNLTVTNSFGCVSTANTTVVVNTLPGATASSNSPVCAGATLNLFGGPSGNTYAWTGPNGFTSSLQNPSITNVTTAASGVYNLTVTNSLGCSSTANTTVVVNALPGATASSNSPVCVATTLNLTGGPSGYTYAWTGPNGFTSNLQSPSIANVTTAAAGTYNLTVTNTFGCISTASTIVVVNPLPVPTITGPATVCAGSTGNVYTTQTGMSNYQWVVSSGGTITGGGGITNNSVTITWNTAGPQTVSVKYTNANLCTAANPTVYNVTVNPSATPTIGSNNTPCEGSIDNMYYTEQGMTNYNWIVSTGGIITMGQGTYAIHVTWTLPGTAWVTVTYTNTYGCGTPVPGLYNLFVNPLPGAAGEITGTSTVCAGATGIAYSTTPIVNASSYTWTLPAGATFASGQGTTNITVNFSTSAVSGNIIVSGTNSCGNGPASPPFPVTVNPLPGDAGTISGPTPVCQGDMGVSYTVTAIPNATGYAWTVPTGATIVSGGNTNHILVNFSDNAVSGIIVVHGTNSCGSGAPSPNFNVTVNPVPSPPTITVDGIILTSSASNGNQWYYNGNPIPGATGQTWEAQFSGWYWAVVTINGCSSDTSNHIYIIMPGFEEKPLAASFQIYPVPNDGRFNISVSLPVEDTYNILVYSYIGEKLYELSDVLIGGKFEKLIDLRPVPDGIYTIVFTNNKNMIVKKILVKK